MKKYFLILLLLIAILGCEKKSDSLIDEQVQQVSVKNFTNEESYTYNYEDSSLVIYISFDNVNSISQVWSEVYSSENKSLNSPLYLYDNGKNGDLIANDKTYSSKFYFSLNFPNGMYRIEYYIKDNSGFTYKVAYQDLKYSNGKNNKAPVISSLTAPDTVIVDVYKLLLLTLAVSDTNGYNDIESVYFISFRPDGSTSNTKIYLYDDGLSNHGDVTANDGIFSCLIGVDPANTKGTYRFEFEAKDRMKMPSNKIIHYITLL